MNAVYFPDVDDYTAVCGNEEKRDASAFPARKWNILGLPDVR